jgi:hypothetical protein
MSLQNRLIEAIINIGWKEFKSSTKKLGHLSKKDQLKSS